MRILRIHTAIVFVLASSTLAAPQVARAQRNCPDVRPPRASAGIEGRVSVSASGTVGVAAPPTDAQLREAAELAARARAQINAGNLRAALPDLERAFSLSHDVSLLGDLGLALHAAGRIDEAWAALTRFRLEARAAYEPVRARIDAALAAIDLNGSLTASGALTTSPPPAEAQLREAAELAARARVQINAGNLRAALPDLERAFSLSHDVALLGDLGLALQAAGRLPEAWLALHRFRLEARGAYEPVRARIDAALAAIEPQLGGLVVESNVPGAALLIRGQVAARLPMETPVFVAPGEVSVTLRARGRADVAVNTRVEAGARVRARGSFAAATLPNLGPLAVGVPAVSAPALGVTAVSAPDLGAPNVSAPNVQAPGVRAPAVGTPGVAVPAPPAPNPWPIVLSVGAGVVLTGGIIASIVHANLNAALNANLCTETGGGPECPSIRAGLGITTALQAVGYTLAGLSATAGIVLFAVLRAAPAVPSAPTIDCGRAERPRPRALRPALMCVPGVSDSLALGCVGTF